jgi:thioredoxin-related protein
VILFLSTEGCIHCTRMRDGSLNDRRVTSAIQNGFVPAALKLDGDSSLARDLRVTIYPTTVIIAPDGKILDYVRGYTSPEQLEPRLARALRENPATVASRSEPQR